MTIRSLLLMCVAVVSLSACGGGGGGGITDPNTQVLAAGAYKLAFAAISTARLDAPISGIDVAVKLPAGLSVATIGGVSGQIADASLTVGSALQATALAFGNYSISTRTAYLTMATTQVDYRAGQFLNLLFTVGSGTSVTPNDIFALNSTFLNYRVVGLDTVTHSTVDLTGKVKTTLGVVR